ncbi:Protein unc-79 -like protein [Halotydeus destructor]|nr:Protein unc-79 -like protein [Halotydeus destructor]
MQAIEPETVTELADVERSEQNRIQQGVTQLLTNVVKPENPEAGPVTWTIGDSAPLKLLPGKPVPERLLPIGPQRPKNYPATLPPLVHPSRPRSDNMPLPAHERLLPIGPPPRDRSKSPGPQTGSRRLTSPQGRECNSPFSGPLPDLPEVGLTAEKKISEPTPIVIPPDLGPPPNSAPPVLQKVESLPVAPPVTQKVDPPPVAPPVAESNVKPKDKRQPSLEKEIKDEAANAKSEPLTTKSGDKGEKGEEVETSPDKKVKKKKVKKDKQSKSTPTSPKSDKKKLPNRPSAMEGSMESKRGKLGVLGHSFSLDLGDDDLMGSSPKTPPADQKGAPGRYKQRRQRKTGLKTIEAQRSVDSKCAAAPAGACAANVQRRARKTDSNSTTGTSGGSSMQGAIGSSKRSSTSQVSLTGPAFDEGNIFERCNLCANILEKFSDDELGMCIVILGTYVHREPGVAARILPDMLRLVAKFAINYSPYPWTTESSIHLPGNVACIARQFLRCVSYQLTSNGLFQKLFSSHFVDHELFKALSVSLGDFGPINQVSPLTTILGDLNDKKHLPPVGDLMHLLGNIADYLDTIAYENPLSAKVAHWDSFIANFDTFLKNLALILPNERSADLSPILRIMLITLKLPVISAHKIILDTYSKIISIAIQQYTLSYHQLIDICHNCSKSFTKDRDRFILSRTASFELFQAMKFKLVIPDDNFLILVQLILQDAGGTIVPSIVTENLKSNAEPDIESMSTSAADCMKQYVNDAMEFISDVHTILKIKSNSFGNCVRLNEESLGGHLKASLSQWVALDITRSNSRDHRAVSKYLPWLYTLPSVQQGPKEFLDCVAHIRVLSWLLLGSLQHSALFVNGHSSQYPLCQPIPLEANGHIAEHIQVILAGFAEQSKSSVLHMSSLFHAFILCQLWTMYCENISGQNPPGGEQYTHITLIMYDFWVKITPGILQLVCHSKVLAEMVSLHFLSLMEALMESNSNMLSRLLPMWTAVFKSYQGQLSSHLQVRLQACVNWQPPPQVKEYQSQPSLNPKAPLLRWLQKVQFKMSQIETQSSQATQFYPM